MSLKIKLLFVALSASVFSWAQKASYNYTVDLTKVVDDRVYVELKTPKITTDETTFYLPKMIPGTYSIADYGRFVVDLKAFDKKGNALPVVKADENSWKISSAKKLAMISYWIDDVVDTPKEGPSVYPMAATNIEEGKNFVLNTSGVFGYFENKKDVGYGFSVIRPKEFYGSTGLIAVHSDLPVASLKKETAPQPDDKRIDKYYAENYDRLIDSPLMYAKADTAVIRVANTEVLIGCYSPNQKISAKEIAATIKDVLTAQNSFLGGKLPVDKYAFIFYFTDKPINSYGALEHSYSSFYYMPEKAIDDMKQQLRDFAAHEFFHIVTPLNIHSEEIHKFDFNDPKMSRHLWMYEGVTEYFAGNVQVKYGLIPREQYLNVLSGKMVIADNFLDEVPFTDISLFTLDKYQDQYYNVYMKGALIGMCLDIKLRKLSGGKYGMQNLMADLSKKFGKDQAFEDDELFADIEKLTYPEIGEFLKRYVAGPEKLPFDEVFPLVGVKHEASVPDKKYSIGFGSSALALAEINGEARLKLAKASGITEQGRSLGLQADDILLKVNNTPIAGEVSEMTGVIFQNFQALKEGEQLSFTVSRKDAQGNEEIKELTAPVKMIDSVKKHVLSFDENASAEALATREAWLSPQVE
jgi:predicted metalloprotease with PDZ domain